MASFETRVAAFDRKFWWTAGVLFGVIVLCYAGLGVALFHIMPTMMACS